MNEDERQAEDGGVDDALVARDIFVLAFLAQKAGKHTLARAAWHKYVTIRPTDPRGHHNLATCLRNAHEDTAALASFEQAFALKPSLGEAAANAAGILIRNGDCDRACELCFRALEGDPECSVALYNLNVALRMAGRQNEAIAFSWRWILRRLPRAMSAGERLPAVAATFAGPAKATDAVDAVDAADVGVDDEVAMGCPPAKEGEQVLHASAAANRQAQAQRQAHQADANASVDADGDGDGDSDADSNGGACGAGGDTSLLTVVCVKWGSKYGVEYVDRLARGVRRNLDRPSVFVCFTDDVEALRSVEGVEARPLGRQVARWRGWWNKGFLFSSDAGLTGRIMYLDLDTIVSGSLDDLAAYCGKFATLSAAAMVNERRPAGLNSSVMCWDAGHGCDFSASYAFLQEAHDVVAACVYKFDHWLEMTVENPQILQEMFPGQVVEYAAEIHSPSPPSLACSTCSTSPLPSPLRPLPGGSGDEPLGEKVATLTPAFTPDSASTNDLEGCGDDGAVMRRSTGGFTGVSSDGGRKIGDRLTVVPANARVVCFPLQPKPHQVLDQPWVQRLWLGSGES